MILVATVLAGVLDDPDFRFCHENRSFDHNETLCPLLTDVPSGTCPGLEAFCVDPQAAPPAGCQGGGMGTGPLARGSSDGVDSPTTWDPPAWLPSGGEGFSGTGQVLAWIVAILVAFVVGGLGILLLRQLGWRREPEREPRVTRVEAEEEVQSFAEAVDDVPDLPPDDLLAAARSAAQAGQLGEAATLARGAVLRRLGEDGVLRLHRAHSDREYVRQTEGSTRQELAEVLDVAAQHRWGRVPLTRGPVDRALTAAARLVGTLLLLCLALPALGADRFGPAGDVALYRVAGEGLDVRFHRGAFAELDEDLAGLILDTSAVAPSDDDWIALFDWVASGHLLVVAGAVEGLGERVPTEGRCTGELAHGPRVAGDLLGYTEGTPLLTCGSAPVAVLVHGEGLVVGVADPMVVWNGALMVPDNVSFWRDLFTWLDEGGWTSGPVAFATWGGSTADDSHVRSLANLALLPFALHVLLLWAVVAWSQRAPVVPRIVRSAAERPFVDHVLAVADHHRRVDDRRHTLVVAARLLLDRRTPAAIRSEGRRLGWTDERVDDRVARAVRLADPDHEPDLDDPDPDDLLEDLWTLIRT